MASNFKYVPKKSGFKQMFNSHEMCDLCTQHANAIARRANGMYGASGYEVSPGRPGKNRCHAIVYTGDMHSVNSNRRHNTLLKALG